MFGLLMVAVAIFLIMTMPLTTMLATGDARQDTRDLRAAQVQQVGAALSSYIEKHSQPPASLQVLQAEPGNQFVGGFLQQPFTGYAVSATLTDANWQYQRITVFAQEPKGAVSSEKYLSAEKNTCGSADFNTADSWCGDKESRWFRLETRDLFGDWMKRQKLRQNRTIHKLAIQYNYDGQFPAISGGSNTLANLAGYAGSATACSGVFKWNDVPLDCNDLFSIFGTPVTVNRTSAETIYLVSRTPMVNAAGSSVPAVTLMPLELN